MQWLQVVAVIEAVLLANDWDAPFAAVGRWRSKRFLEREFVMLWAGSFVSTSSTSFAVCAKCELDLSKENENKY